jgi:hypothetical protein
MIKRRQVGDVLLSVPRSKLSLKSRQRMISGGGKYKEMQEGMSQRSTEMESTQRKVMSIWAITEKRSAQKQEIQSE